MATLTCAHCGRRVRKRVVYGYPGPETIELSKAGKVVLGGCCLPPEPIRNWLCDVCRVHSQGAGADAEGDAPAPDPASERRV